MSSNNDKIIEIMDDITKSLKESTSTMKSSSSKLKKIISKMKTEDSIPAKKKFSIIKEAVKSINQINRDARQKALVLERLKNVSRIYSDISSPHDSTKQENEYNTFNEAYDEDEVENKVNNGADNESQYPSYQDDTYPEEHEDDEENLDSPEENENTESEDDEGEQSRSIEEKIKNRGRSNDEGKNKLSKLENPKDTIKDKAKETAKQASKKAAQAAGRAAKSAGKAFIHLIKFLFTPPILWVTLICIAIVVVLALIFFLVMFFMGSAAAPYENVDPANGQFATSNGITGDKFYGARAIYLDPEQAQLDLKDYYYAFSEDFLENVDALEHVNLNINANLENITPELSKLIAKAVSASTEDLTLEQYLTSIDHFGYTNIELDNIQISFVDYVLDNQSTLLTIEEGYSNLETDLNNTFDTKYSSYNVTAPLYYVKDIVLEENEEAMVPSEEAKNFVAMIYMPRTDVVVEASSYMFYFPETEKDPDSHIDGYASSVDIEFITVVNGEHNSIYSNTANSTWWQDDTAEVSADIENANINLAPFTSIDTENPLENISLYSLMLNENKVLLLDTQNGTVSFENTNKYFSNTLIEDSESGETYYEISYLSQDLSYYYLKFSADGIFQFCEYETVFE